MNKEKKKRVKQIRQALCMWTLSALIMIPLVSCGAAENKKEDNRLSMYVGLGNTNGGYYAKLHDMILEETGIDVKYTYNMTLDTSTAALNKIKSGDLPADIMITANVTPPELQKEAFLDLAAVTNIPDLFSFQRISEVSVDGGVYQLPFSTRLIGFEYNETLFHEMGWEVPETYQEMLELKKKADEAGIVFAVSGGAATGHGFNYLFHLMGTNFLCSANGTQWLNSFLKGTESIARFQTEGHYFKEYVESGLFDTLHDEDWLAGRAAQKVRALFYYNILNDAYSYHGFRYNPDGTLYGAEYTADGQPVMTEDAAGSAVFDGEEYVLFDENNEKHRQLPRYSIPGTVVLNDEYKALPWISENGNSNCFASYDNMEIALDKRLGEKKNAEKLQQAVKVLEFMTTQKATDLFTELYVDGYVAVKDFEIDNSRVYAAYKDKITQGYLMPWYYTNFDNETINNVGKMVNSYIKSGGLESYDAIMEELENNQKQKLNQSTNYVAEITETLGYEDSAKVLAIAGGLALQEKYDELGIGEEVTAALLPYTTSLSEMPLYQPIGVAQEKFYQDKIPQSGFSAYIGNGHRAPVGIRMSGSELKQLQKKGYNTLADYEYDHTYFYVIMTKDGSQIKDDQLYLVAVAPGSLESEVYDAFLTEGKVILSEEKPAAGDTQAGLARFFETHPVLSKKTISWQ